MFVNNGLDVSAQDYFGRREDLSFIVRFNWKSSHHLKEAIQVLLAARLDDGSDQPRVSRLRSEILDEAEFEAIRVQIAANPSTPSIVLGYLAKHSSIRVLERIAENPNTQPHTLEYLAQCSIASVRAAVAENANASSELLTMLATDADSDVRYRIAENHQVTLETLEALAEDSNPYVSHRAAATIARIKGGSVVEAPFQERARSTSRLQAKSR